ncbi:hypothetical protein [Gimesia maris]|uniref:hypothetical protein n=1 Tax=Gimesia maris TaxID=122 RepID=UPI0030DACCD4|tara:strand:- start:68227 stop:68388 length:162 start_codon:yes stop_codon:yes gene_type:complete
MRVTDLDLVDLFFSHDKTLHEAARFFTLLIIMTIFGQAPQNSDALDKTEIAAP